MTQNYQTNIHEEYEIFLTTFSYFLVFINLYFAC